MDGTRTERERRLQKAVGRIEPNPITAFLIRETILGTEEDVQESICNYLEQQDIYSTAAYLTYTYLHHHAMRPDTFEKYRDLVRLVNKVIPRSYDALANAEVLDLIDGLDDEGEIVNLYSELYAPTMKHKARRYLLRSRDEGSFQKSDF